MTKLLSALIAAVFAVATLTPVAVAQDKKDEKSMEKKDGKKKSDKKKSEEKK